jgi:hypothetical protein
MWRRIARCLARGWVVLVVMSYSCAFSGCDRGVRCADAPVAQGFDQNGFDWVDFLGDWPIDGSQFLVRAIPCVGLSKNH